MVKQTQFFSSFLGWLILNQPARKWQRKPAQSKKKNNHQKRSKKERGERVCVRARVCAPRGLD